MKDLVKTLENIIVRLNAQIEQIPSDREPLRIALANLLTQMQIALSIAKVAEDLQDLYIES